ncbi:MAG: FtsW/RodA/SpoVE family cell cycle protein, partial [Clostridiales bacterium]|nr:FtsW/RodA/SpoVE family cell cycle protein [Clostridiales bacterium]
GYLSLPNGSKILLNHWENIIGRSKSSDVYMDYPTLSRSHAAVIRDIKGLWRLYDLGSKGGVMLNGKKIDERVQLRTGDIITLGGVELVFIAISKYEQAVQSRERVRPAMRVKPCKTLFYLTLFQVALGLQLCISFDDALPPAVPVSFIALMILTWLCYLLTRVLRRVAFEIETIAFFLCTIGLGVAASSVPEDLYRHTALLAAGILLYFLMAWFLRDLNRAVKLRWPIAVAGLLLLAANLLLSGTVLGARNWLKINGISFQPSEFVKIAFVFAGATALDRLFARRNLVLFIAFSGSCVMALALMGDFGTALVFFVAYLIISFIRSGDLATVFLSVAGAGFAGFMAVTLKPHVAARFTTWGHAWEYANASGYQQTRTMAAAASGGLFGVGAGNGWLKRVFAADTDMVFGILCEELGLIVAAAAAFSLLVLAFHVIHASRAARSSFYVIGASAAVAILIFQMLLNTLGSVDILPFTGVTFPFVSKGGSSLVACWGLLAFIKAVDTRRNASFVVRTPKHISKKENRLFYEHMEADEYLDDESDSDSALTDEFEFGEDIMRDDSEE